VLLLADQPPFTLDEWEQWLVVIRRAVRKEAVIVDRNPGRPDDTAAAQLIHSRCDARTNPPQSIVPAASAASDIFGLA
jgi:hypothetical protein